MKKNPLLKLQEYRQSIWLDYLHRRILDSGELQEMIDNDGLRGVTSNPSIFQKAIGQSDDYNETIQKLVGQGKNVEEIYQHLVVDDVRRAADLFRPLYEDSDGAHGFVSLEVNPHLAHDTEGTVTEARFFWNMLDRPNVFIKVPATKEGLPAIRQLISEGINVNVTLLFGLPRYREVAEAYIAGLEDAGGKGRPLARTASVASFFLSRIDVLIDKRLEEIAAGSGEQSETARRLQGEVAVASARKAYQMYKDIFGGQRFTELASLGARPQRVLWASTSTKNPAYSDVKYVEALIGPETINTLPRKTLDAYRDHGDPAERLEDDPVKNDKVLAALSTLGIDIDAVTVQLEDEGVDKFNRPYDQLMESLTKRMNDAGV